jgi:hypothetical protein
MEEACDHVIVISNGFIYGEVKFTTPKYCDLLLRREKAHSIEALKKARQRLSKLLPVRFCAAFVAAFPNEAARIDRAIHAVNTLVNLEA